MSPLLTRRRVMAAKIEDTPGTAEALSASEAAFNVFEPQTQPNVEFNERDGQGATSPLAGVPGARGGQATFAVEVVGSGSVGAPVPAWASTFLPACGLYDDSDIFKLDSRPPEAAGSNAKTLTIGVYEDGLLKVLRGCMGNAVMRFTAGRPARIEFTFTGLWVQPSDVALLAPNYPSTLPRRFASSALTIGSWTPKVAEVTVDLGNEVVLREDATDLTGYHSAVIVNRRVTGTLNPESTLIASADPHADWLNPTERALLLRLGVGSADGNLIQLDAPKFQLTNVQGGDRGGVGIHELSFQLNRSADAGEDELTVTFS